MTAWQWLKSPAQPYTWGFIGRVVLKTALLFGLANLLFAWAQPIPTLGRLTWYNTFINGRERLPYGENAALAYNLSLNDLNAMFASHAISGGKAEDEFRVVLLGDSATWGFLLTAEDTLAGQLNRAGYQTADGQNVRVYNLGYPTMSLTKDLLLLERALDYDPDLMIWLVTLESFPRAEQLESPLAANSRAAVLDLTERFGLILPLDALIPAPDFWGNTLVGQRRALADWLRLQVYGLAWQTTGIDQAIPESYTLRQSDFDEDVSWHGLDGPPTIPDDYLAWDVLEAGMALADSIPMVLVNEPMFISTGQNSDLRYNFFYPRWVYDAYREDLATRAEAANWHYLDLWDSIAPDEFTDSPVHMTPAGTRQLADLLAPVILQAAEARP